jgi:hypothetical protein
MAPHEYVKTAVRDAPGEPIYRNGLLCLKCGSQDLRVRPRSFFHRVFSVAVFDCSRCDYHETRFSLSPATLIVPIILALMGGGTYYLLKTQVWIRGDEGTLNTADALAKARSSSGALSTFELMMLKKPRNTMDNQSILQLVHANVGSAVITQMVRASNADYDVSPGAVITLKKAGVDESIILAMIDQSYNVR